MKKKVVKKSTSKAAPKKVVKAVTRKKTSTSKSFGVIHVFLKRFIIVTPVILLMLGVVSIFVQKPMTQEVAGVSIFRGIFGQASVQLPNLPQAVSYNVYYKPANAGAFTNAARNIPASATNYLITYLKKNTDYEYRISAVDTTGAEFWFSPVLPLTNIQSM